MAVDPDTLVANDKRRRILNYLANGPASVGELGSSLGYDQVTTSRHLKALRDGGLVSSRTAGQRRIYSLTRAAHDALDRWERRERESSRSNHRR